MSARPVPMELINAAQIPLREKLAPSLGKVKCDFSLCGKVNNHQQAQLESRRVTVLLVAGAVHREFLGCPQQVRAASQPPLPFFILLLIFLLLHHFIFLLIPLLFTIVLLLLHHFVLFLFLFALRILAIFPCRSPPPPPPPSPPPRLPSPPRPHPLRFHTLPLPPPSPHALS
ncbi:hypothetical protein PoB_001088500 [Plakobranchus ocellatus]|uniref:Uncharacterized protein n=1 Tax=Plakobranchus ocellatus TaxID=259542 RepID=A0AAV3YMQ0_9GAST|nr:hypothetical protein PoB_001088500 [Plakobranchus ocellatus]